MSCISLVGRGVAARAQPRPVAWPALARRLLAWLLGAMLLAGGGVARADVPELVAFEITRGDHGVRLSFAAHFDLPPTVVDALQKGVPLHFVARAEVFRERWYWSDERISSVSRTWRLAWQPLTRKYRVSFGGLSQSYDTLSEALSTLRSAVDWKVADANRIEPGERYYLEFTYRLDTSMLPRPMQIGIDGQAEWNLLIERTQRFD